MVTTRQTALMSSALFCGLVLISAQARASDQPRPASEPPTIPPDTQLDENQAPADDETRRWLLVVGGGGGAMSKGGGAIGVTLEAAARPWHRSGVGVRLDAATGGAIMLQTGVNHGTLIATIGHSYQLATLQDGVAGLSIDTLLGPSVGRVSQSWHEGLCLDLGFGTEPCSNPPPRDFQSYEQPYLGVGGGVGANVHISYFVLGLQAGATAGVHTDGGLAQALVGLRLGLSDY